MSNENKKKVLIVEVVEDDAPLLSVLSERFKGEGYNVITAMTGEDGLDLALKNKPDLIVLDIVMPKMDGLTMFRKLRQDSWGKKAKVVLLTNLSADDRITKAVTELEPSYYLIKTDWKLDDIVEKVKSCLE
ncbi:MAG: response regulator [Patescibacteria group bacterium]|nr:response regulator [Patescibacteria group bacterium]